MINSHRIRNKWFLFLAVATFPVAYFVSIPIAVSLVALLGGIYAWAFGALFSKSLPEIPFKRFMPAFLVLGLVWNFSFENPLGFHLFDNIWVIVPIGPLMLAYVGGWIAEKICSKGGTYI